MVLKGLRYLWTKLGWNCKQIVLERFGSVPVVKNALEFQKLSLELKASDVHFIGYPVD